MGKKGQIEHEGIIREIMPNLVKVGFEIQAECEGCHASGVCNLEEKNGELMEVSCFNPEKYSIGEKVKIVIKESLGMKAVFLAYFLPFILIMTSLFIFVPVLKNEVKAGILSLLVLLPYYLMIYIYRGRIKKEINFTIEKI